MPSKEDDYTRYRTPGVIPYTIEAKIGRSDSKDKIAITDMTTVSGAYELLPSSPLGRRDHIAVQNKGPADVMIVTASGSTDGFTLATDDVFEDSTDAIFYVYSSAGSSTIQVYERSSRFNY
jgi:hypothetical protein